MWDTQFQFRTWECKVATFLQVPGERWKAILRDRKGAYIKSRTFSRKSLAEEWADRMELAREEVEASGDQAFLCTFGELVTLYEAEHPERAFEVGRAGHLAFWKRTLGEDTRLSEITQDKVRKALEVYRLTGASQWRGKAGVVTTTRKRSGAAVNRVRSAFASLWKVGSQRGKCSMDNFPLRNIQRERENPGRTRRLTEAELKRLLDACKAGEWAKLYPLVLAAVTSGARRGELLQLTWGAIDWNAGVGRLPTSKNGEPRELILVPEVLAALKPWQELGGVLVFCRDDDTLAPFNFAFQFARALDAAGLPRVGKDKVTFHTLRHSCCTWLAERGVDTLVLQRIMGHKALSTTARYTHPSVARKNAAVSAVMGPLLREVTAPS
jgi:integrase